MDIDTLKALGIKPADLIERIVDKAVEDLLKVQTTSKLSRLMADRIKTYIDAKVEELATKHVLPKVTEAIENVCIQKHNQWGEKTGQSYTFIEYLIARTETFMLDEVDYNGKTKAEGDSYNWRKHSTRVATMVDKHLQFSIETAMKQAMAQANGTIAKGLEGAVKHALAEATAKLTVTATIGR